jgi:ABC-type sulfate transport system permease component
MAQKPKLKQVILGMIKDPLTLVGIALPIIIFVSLVLPLPKNYPGITNYYTYAAVLVGYTVISRYLAIREKIRINLKTKEVDKKMSEVNKLMGEVTTLINKVPQPQTPVNQNQKPTPKPPVKREDMGEYQ